ncbi:MAG: FAD-binding oxidoreductase [Flavobacterium sp.]
MKAIRILYLNKATHNVCHLITERPEGFEFRPGQAADLAIDKPEWEKELRPFTFTSLITDDFLEFYIKEYPEHNGVTEQIGKLHIGDTLNIRDAFGDIKYQGEGIFIAGGAGITPFIAILKDLESKNEVGNNKLIFANNTSADIVEHDYFERLLGTNFINVLSKEENAKYIHGYITKELIEKAMQNRDINFYLCGPPPMMTAILEALKELGIDQNNIIQESY